MMVERQHGNVVAELSMAPFVIVRRDKRFDHETLKTFHAKKKCFLAVARLWRLW